MDIHRKKQVAWQGYMTSNINRNRIIFFIVGVGLGGLTLDKTDGGGTGAHQIDARSEEPVRLLSLWRRSKAEELDVKPFMVLHQKTLVAIVEARPKTEAELLKIDGIGPTKARLYGTEILDIVNS